MAASVVGSSMILRTIRRTRLFSISNATIRPNSFFCRTRISPPRSVSSRVRQLSSLLPVHTAIASACLVSKLPSELTSSECRFANYLSPI